MGIHTHDLSDACGDPWDSGSPCGDHPPRFFFSNDRLALLRTHMPDACEHIIRNAEELCQHRVRIFEIDGMCLGPRIDWHYNFKDRKKIPKRYSLFLNYRNAHRLGDIKYLWEINRHQHLVPLSLAFCLTNKAQFGQEVIAQLTSWVVQNPPGRGINWTSALEVAMRLISWSWTTSLMKLAGVTLPNILYHSMAQHCAFVHSHFSLFSSRGNHLVGEAAGLYMCALLYGREPYRSLWLRDAARTLVEEIHTQVYPDGVHAELSTAYHVAVTELFVLPALLDRHNHANHFPPVYWDALERMLLFLRAITYQDARIPYLGDDDTGQCVALEDSPQERVFSLLTLGAHLFKRPELLPERASMDAKTFLLLGEDLLPTSTGVRSTQHPPARSRYVSHAFAHAGYYIVRTPPGLVPGLFLLFDCGPLGLEPLAGHGHADTLSFFLSVNGHPVFVDPGTYTYRTGDPWRDYFRGTSSHNTIRVDGQEFAVPGGPFFWRRKALGRLIQWKPHGNAVTLEACHDGYRRLKDPVLHCRKIMVMKEARAIIIEDTLEACGTHTLDAFFHLHPACTTERSTEGLLIKGPAGVTLLLVTDPRWEVSVVRASRTPLLGWYSAGYGKLEPTTTIVGTHVFTGTHRYRTRILVCGSDPHGASLTGS